MTPFLCLPWRPKRQRKLPARMQNNDFEYGFGPALAGDPETEIKPDEKPVSTKKRGLQNKKGQQTKPESDEKVPNHNGC